MNITNKQFDTICQALDVVVTLPLPDDARQKMDNADKVISDLLKKKKIINERTAKYIADKRKIDKNYARGIKK